MKTKNIFGGSDLFWHRNARSLVFDSVTFTRYCFFLLCWVFRVSRLFSRAVTLVSMEGKKGERVAMPNIEQIENDIICICYKYFSPLVSICLDVY